MQSSSHPAPPRSPPTASGAARRFGWLLAALLLALVAAEAAYRGVRSSIHPVAGAEWIWHGWELPRGARPTSFYAVRDFRLEEPPQQARLLILADEEYRAVLNGRFLGGNRYRPGMAMDLFDVSEVLVPGANRLVVHLRSERGGGGLLASLQAVAADGSAEPLVQTDPSWAIAPHLRLGEIRGWQPFAELEAVRSWGRAPVGRWGLPRVGSLRQLPTLLAAPEQLWAEIVPGDGSGDTAGSGLLLDWGRPVTGYLALELPAGSPRLGKVYFGEEPPGEREGVVVIAGDQELRWQDARPQRFRYARVVGLPGLTGAYVVPAGEAELPDPGSPAPTFFEAWAPPLSTPSDAAVRPPPG